MFSKGCCFLISLSLIVFATSQALADSFDINTCQYTNSKGEIIDVSSLRQPSAISIPVTSGSTGNWFFNFCPSVGSVTSGNCNIETCPSTVFSCYSDPTTNTCSTISKIQQQLDPTNYPNTVIFSNGGAISTTSRITFECNTAITGTPTYTLVYSSFAWRLTVSHNCACPGACVGGSSSDGLSGGSVLLIIFFPTVFVYLVGGMIFKRTRNGASGVEMVPNIDFWREVPGLIKDGFKFTFSCGGGSGYTRV